MSYILLGGGRGMQLTGEHLIKAYRRMRTIRKFGECMHKEFATRQMPGLVRRDAIKHRGHGLSIGKGAEP